jgi:hypothetical protein
MSATAPGVGIERRNHATPTGTTREMGDPMGWLLRRTKRVEELLAQPAIMNLADELARHMERYCAIKEIDVKSLEVTVLPTQTKRYITLAFGAHECIRCQGVGQMPDHTRCNACEGTGFR